MEDLQFRDISYTAKVVHLNSTKTVKKVNSSLGTVASRWFKLLSMFTNFLSTVTRKNRGGVFRQYTE